jgi:hypothetical protein
MIWYTVNMGGQDPPKSMTISRRQGHTSDDPDKCCPPVLVALQVLVPHHALAPHHHGGTYLSLCRLLVRLLTIYLIKPSFKPGILAALPYERPRNQR